MREVKEEGEDGRAGRGADLVLVVDADSREVDAEERERDRERRDHADADVERGVPHQHRQRAGGERERVEHPHRVLLREPERHEAMRRVIASPLRRRPPGELPQQRHQRSVEDRHQQHEHRYRQHRRDAARPPAARAGGEHARGEEEAPYNVGCCVRGTKCCGKKCGAIPAWVP